MANYVYHAIFTPEEDGSFFINFPDLEGCYPCGNFLEDSIEMVEDALALVFYEYKKGRSDNSCSFIATSFHHFRK